MFQSLECIKINREGYTYRIYDDNFIEKITLIGADPDIAVVTIYDNKQYKLAQNLALYFIWNYKHNYIPIEYSLRESSKVFKNYIKDWPKVFKCVKNQIKKLSRK